MNIGDKVKNLRDNRVGIVIRVFRSGSIAVLESVSPVVINTHDSENTLMIIEENSVPIYEERLILQEKVDRAIEKINLKIKQYEKRIKLREENPCYFDEEKSIKRFYERIEGLELAKKYLDEELR